MTADKLKIQKGSVVIGMGVKADIDGAMLRADHMAFDLDSGLAEVRGNVSVHRGKTELRPDTLTVSVGFGESTDWQISSLHSASASRTSQ